MDKHLISQIREIIIEAGRMAIELRSFGLKISTKEMAHQ